MFKIELDELTHLYRVDGRPVPNSVTGLIKKAGYIDDRFIKEHGRVRGKLTHLAIKYFNDGVLDEDRLDVALRPFFSAYISFLVDSNFAVTASELAVYDPVLDVAGTIDLEGFFRRSPGILYVADTKTGKMPGWAKYQVAAYVLLRNDGYRRRFGVELRKNGEYRLKRFDDNMDYEVARKMMEDK